MRSLTVILGCLTVATCPAQTPNWTQIKPITSPSARSDHAMVYDSARQRIVLFGGRNFQNTYADTWEWDGKNWMLIKTKTSPSARSHHAMAYDSVRQRTVLFSGVTANGTADTWEFDSQSWTLMKPKVSPPGLAGAAMVYDTIRGRTVLFGSPAYLTKPCQTWEWDGTNWTRMNPKKIPPSRLQHNMVFDIARGRTVLFGGYASVLTVLRDTWEWDGKNWTQSKPTSSPPGRGGAGMAYDSMRRRTLMFGGAGTFGVLLGDTWEWDGKNWTQWKHTIAPFARTGLQMAYDSVRQRAVLSGGTTGLFGVSDTWEHGVAKLTLTANTPTISIANGGMQTLSINAGADLKNMSYWIFGSMTGTMPGVVLTGIHIPLRPDPYTDIVIGAVNGKEFKNFKRTLSATGTATASLNVPAKLPIPTGFKLYHAYVVYDGTTGQLFTSSNPVSVEFK